MKLCFMWVIYILEPCMYQWKELEITVPTIPNTQNRRNRSQIQIGYKMISPKSSLLHNYHYICLYRLIRAVCPQRKPTSRAPRTSDRALQTLAILVWQCWDSCLEPYLLLTSPRWFGMVEFSRQTWVMDLAACVIVLGDAELCFFPFYIYICIR